MNEEGDDQVWTDAAESRLLDRFEARGGTFLYQPGVVSGARGLRDHAGPPFLVGHSVRAGSHF